ncbi:MAG: class 1b ribonucleoside-diphosphate reductase subunit beta [Sweet potato little leaf phytoplasma]|nr:class 1b ribonucleoside-diphosphate reductase subunit beta [Sweet potato little leaf phytoplasma]
MDLKKITYQGANWNNLDDDFTHHFYEQNLSQFWRPEDISLQSDLHVWNTLSPWEQKTYSRNLLVLTFLDTYQGDIGMPVLVRACLPEEHQKKATLSFMGAMENAVHAKSYSNIFMTFLNKNEIDDLFCWGMKQKNLQNILNLIINVYEMLDQKIVVNKNDYVYYNSYEFREIKWKAMVASVFLETWLFYSGFYYPLYFYGQGKLMQAGEIINLIIRDESIHGVYTGRLAKNLYSTFDPDQKKKLYSWLENFLFKLYQEQKKLSFEIYQEINLVEDVNKFVRYNANKALLNLGFEQYFPYEEINPVILNGLNTETKTMDYFSMKGNGYQKMKTESLKDEDFIF